MILLNTTSDVLRLTTSAATAVDVHSTYVDSTALTFAPGRKITAIASATTTTIVASPAASTDRTLKTLSIVPRGGSQTLTVEAFDGTTAVQLRSVQLIAGESLHYDDALGWRVLGVDGSMKITSQNGWLNSLSTINWTPGSPATVTHTLLAAGHAAGLYQINRALTQLAASTTGEVAITTQWKPPNAATQTPTAPQGVHQGSTNTTRATLRAVLSNSTTAGVGIAMPLASSVIASDGSADITQTFSHSSVVVNFDLYSSIQRVG